MVACVASGVAFPPQRARLSGYVLPARADRPPEERLRARMSSPYPPERLPAHTMLPALSDATFNRIANRTRRILGVPTALVTLVDREHQAFPGAVGLPEPWQTERETPLSHSFCQQVVARAEPLVVVDAYADPRVAGNGAIDETPAEKVIGSALWDLLPATVGTEFESAIRRVRATGASETLEHFYPEPLNRWYEIRATRVDDRLSLFLSDISERRRIQEITDAESAHDRSVAHTLQQALLTDLPKLDGFQVVARYLAAASTDQVGGDWYDAVPQPDGTLSVSIGDVSGHGIEAAAVMGQLRSMLRGFLWDNDRSVAANVMRLDCAARNLDDRPMTATLVTAGITAPNDSGAATLTWTNAGPLPPLLITPAGVELLETPPDLMIGVDPSFERHEHVRELPPGSTLLFCTDSLVETRRETITVGLTRLLDVATEHRDRDLSDFIDVVFDNLSGAHHEDDIAVLAVRTIPMA